MSDKLVSSFQLELELFSVLIIAEASFEHLNLPLKLSVLLNESLDLKDSLDWRGNDLLVSFVGVEDSLSLIECFILSPPLCNFVLQELYQPRHV